MELTDLSLLLGPRMIAASTGDSIALKLIEARHVLPSLFKTGDVKIDVQLGAKVKSQAGALLAGRKGEFISTFAAGPQSRARGPVNVQVGKV